jgi:hypothetical protein
MRSVIFEVNQPVRYLNYPETIWFQGRGGRGEGGSSCVGGDALSTDSRKTKANFGS